MRATAQEDCHQGENSKTNREALTTKQETGNGTAGDAHRFRSKMSTELHEIATDLTRTFSRPLPGLPKVKVELHLCSVKAKIMLTAVNKGEADKVSGWLI